MASSSEYIDDEYEAQRIKTTVGKITDVDEDLVGMRIRLSSLISELQLGSGGVQMVGIWGIGGGGKTTLATSVYEEISHQFKAHCIVENIREESRKYGLKSLQEQVLSTILKKHVEVKSVEEGKQKIKSMLCCSNLLILLDDVDNLDQLEALVGSRDWFGDGSRIIITTRDKQLLHSFQVDVVHGICLLNMDEAIRLFSKHAFLGNKPIEDRGHFTKEIVHYGFGHPLVLKVLGGIVYDKDRDGWISTLGMLKAFPYDGTMLELLDISYNGLKFEEKMLFLDIACFFRRVTKDEAMVMLDVCGFHLGKGVNVLVQKALVTIVNGKFDMHDMVQDFAYHIIQKEDLKNPEKLRRVWRLEDSEHMCYRDETTIKEYYKNEVIRYSSCSSSISKLYSNIEKLMLINVPDHPYVYHMVQKNVEEPNIFSNELSYIHWVKYPANSLPDNFHPTKLIVLKLHHSLQEELWRNYKYIPSLKVLDLHGSNNLIRTPNFEGLLNLEILVLSGCSSLKEIDIGCLERLVYLNLDGCCKLQVFPTFDKMKRLETLILSRCPQLLNIPDIQQHVACLKYLYLDESGIEVLPSSVGKYCTNLSLISLIGCKNLKKIECKFTLFEQECVIIGGPL